VFVVVVVVVVEILDDESELVAVDWEDRSICQLLALVLVGELGLLFVGEFMGEVVAVKCSILLCFFFVFLIVTHAEKTSIFVIWFFEIFSFKGTLLEFSTWPFYVYNPSIVDL
jgi:hypothetical protein